MIFPKPCSCLDPGVFFRVFLYRRLTSAAEPDARSRCETWQQLHHVCFRDRDAALGRRIARTRYVQEYRATTSAYAGALVMIEHDHVIVKLIRAPHAFGARGIGMANLPIVIPVCRRVAPAIPRAQVLQPQPCRQPPEPVRTVVCFEGLPDSGRRCTVPLLFAPADPAAAERAPHLEVSADQPSDPRAGRDKPHNYVRQRPETLHATPV
jgi:hypothetical protein